MDRFIYVEEVPGGVTAVFNEAGLKEHLSKYNREEMRYSQITQYEVNTYHDNGSDVYLDKDETYKQKELIFESY